MNFFIKAYLMCIFFVCTKIANMIKLNIIEGLDIPLVSFESVNPKAKEEVYEQLVRIKEILGR